jgi:hypothetical protein
MQYLVCALTSFSLTALLFGQSTAQTEAKPVEDKPPTASFQDE